MATTLVFAAAVAVYPPGHPRGVYNISSTLCQDQSNSDNGTCFFGIGNTAPSTLCREFDSECSTGQREVETFGITHPSSTCSVYSWHWMCATTERMACGKLWCDMGATCIDNVTCVCPPPMRGDAVWHTCACPFNHVRQNNTCVPIPVCLTTTELTHVLAPTTTPTVSPASLAATSERDCEFAWVWLVLIVVGVAIALIFGLWCGLFHCDNQVEPERRPTYSHLDRTRINRMYDSQLGSQGSRAHNPDDQ